MIHEAVGNLEGCWVSWWRWINGIEGKSDLFRWAILEFARVFDATSLEG